MKVVLCSVPVESPGSKLRRERSDGPKPIMPKVAITSLNHWAEKNGFDTCDFYDIDMLYPSDEDIKNYFEKIKADIVGLSAVVSTSYMQVRRLANIIKNVNKNTLIVCGGYLTAASNTVLRKTDVDICVVGDGEIAWVGILNVMKKSIEGIKNKFDIDELLKVKGIAMLDDKKNLKFSGYGQTLPSCHMSFPSFEYLKTGLLGDNEAVKNYFRPFYKHEEFIMDERSFEKWRKPMAASILVSKGCVAKCTFCQRGSKGYSVYNLDKLESHLKNLRDNCDVGFLCVDDENFGSNKKYSYQVAELFNKYDMLWSSNGVRCTSVEKKDLIHFKKNGCSSMKFGIESGSQTMLDIMEKKFVVDDIKKAIYSCIDLDLSSPVQGFMVGMPGESLKTAEESGQLLGELAARLRVPLDLIYKNNSIFYCIPLVGTPMYEYGKQLGLIGQTVDDEEKYLELTSNVAQHKRYYINFNGAPMSEVVFWDILIFLEATRTYVKLMQGKSEDENLKKKYKNQLNVQGLNPQRKAKERQVPIMGGAGLVKDVTFNQYFVTNFLKENVVFNKTIARLPKFMIYPIARYALYFEYLVQKYFFKDEHNLHRTTNAKVKSKIRIGFNLVDPTKTSQKDRSLRTIVEKKMAQFNRSEEEKTLSFLTGGP